MPALAAFIGALLGALVILVGPMLALALFGGGATWLTGNHDRGKSVLIAAFIGAAIMLLANQIATSVLALPHGA